MLKLGELALKTPKLIFQTIEVSLKSINVLSKASIVALFAYLMYQSGIMTNMDFESILKVLRREKDKDVISPTVLEKIEERLEKFDDETSQFQNKFVKNRRTVIRLWKKYSKKLKWGAGASLKWSKKLFKLVRKSSDVEQDKNILEEIAKKEITETEFELELEDLWDMNKEFEKEFEKVE